MNENKLLFGDQALQLVQNIVKFGVWYYDLKHNKIEWDDKMFEIYEVDKSSFTGSIDVFQSLIHPDDLAYVDTVMQYASAQNNLLQASFRIITGTQRLKYIDGNIQPLTDFDGNVIGFIGVNKDVTEKKLNEIAGKESEEKYRKLLKEFSKLSAVAEKTINAVVITDTNGHTQWVNDSFTKMTGYTLHEIRNKKPGEILQGGDTDPLSVKMMSNCIRQKKSFEVSVVNYRKNAERYWVEIIANPYFNESGEAEGFIAIQTEITERKQLEDRIKAERDRAKMYLDTVGSIVIILNVYGIIQLTNKAAQKILGAETAEELIGKNWFLNFLPNPEAAAEQQQAFYHAIEGRADLNEFAEHEICSLTGECKLMEWHNVLLHDANGRINGCILSGKDITEQRRMETELKESKEFYRSIFDGSMNAVLLADDNNRYIDANPAAVQLLGYSREELIQMCVTDLATDARPERLENLWSDFMDAHHQTGLIELQRKDGKKVIVEYRATANIKPGVHLSVLTDVTDKIEYQNAIAAQNKTLREIAWIQSHEIRRPLSNILGLFELLKLEAEKQESETLDMMLASVLELDALIKQLVNKSRTVEGLNSQSYNGSHAA